MNNQSTGAVFFFGGMTFITDIKGYSGTYIFDGYGNKAGKTDALMWYAVEFENNIYFSNQSCNNYLYRMSLQTGVTEKIYEIPCKNLIKYNNFIFLIDERNGAILAYNCQSGEFIKVAEVQADSFVIIGNDMFYSSNSGIGAVSLSDRHEKTISPIVSGELSAFGGYLLLSDIKNSGALSMLNPENGQLFRIGNICSDSFAIHENSVFAANENEGRAINKIDIQSGRILRIYGEPAYNLCVCGGWLYFTDESKSWCRMNVSGENFTKIVF